MIKIINCHERQNKEGKSFISLELMGDVELIQSLSSGKFYATSRRTSIPSTFTLAVGTGLIGSTLPGHIIRVETEAYDFKIPDSDEVITLAHTYQYVPEETPNVVPSNPLPDRMFSLKSSLITS